uniref:DUF6534 domain-containing protein n=1 Tax=Mycena chlorophos TaxID=658473 RepID=A0ABQ0LNU6_MYCCL|nr:predicted protein [Mycena chlorophos]
MSSNSTSASAPSGPPPGAPDVTSLFGPLLLGVLLNTTLYGVMMIQAYLYFNHFKRFVTISSFPSAIPARILSAPAPCLPFQFRPLATGCFFAFLTRYIWSGEARSPPDLLTHCDRSWFKWLVGYLVVVETANVVCDIGLIYEPLIIRYAQLEALVTSPILLRADGLLTVLVSCPAQLFVAWRLHVITCSYLLSLTIAFLSIVALGGGISVSAIVTMHPDFASFPAFKPEVFTWLIASAGCDVLLTSALVVSLWTRKSKVAATDSYVNKIIRLTVQTGMITAAAALTDMLLYALIPNTTFNFIIDFPLSKLYTNSLLSTLNARPWRQDHAAMQAPNVLFEPSSHSHSGGFSGTTTSGGGAGGVRSRISVTPAGGFSGSRSGTSKGKASEAGLGMGLTYPPTSAMGYSHSHSSRSHTPTAVNVTLTTESFLDMAPASAQAYPVDSKDGEMQMHDRSQSREPLQSPGAPWGGIPGEAV